MTTLNEHIGFARTLVHVLDLRFNVFGLRFGIDPLLNVIPGAGNVASAATSCYLFWLARKLNVPRSVYIRMTWYILLDYVLGLLPAAGIVFDMFYRANVKNLALLETYFDPSVIPGEVVG